MFLKQPPVEPPTGEQPGATTTPGGLPKAGEGGGKITTPGAGGQLPAGTGTPFEQKPSETANGGITKTKELSSASSMSATLGSTGSNLQYYNKTDGKFYRLNANGQAEAISDKVFHSVEKVVWSPNKNKAILEYPDGANIIYDFTDEKQISLPSHWKDFDFSPSGGQIVMKSMGLDPSNRWLAIVNEDGSKVRAVESMGENEGTVYPAWSPNNQSVAMYTKGVSFDRQEVFFVGLNNENFKSTIVEGRDFRPKWDPAGDKLLYSVYSSANDLKPSIWLVNASGDNIGSSRKSLNLETWADKCTFAKNSDIYCAVPENLEEGAGLFPEMAKNTKDNLYKIDAKTGAKKLLAVPDGSYNMSNIIISDNSSNLYFTDETTGKIYGIRLK
jgi:dipeptidyl aminopeptidase/acylaminoacyl peptidase